MKFILSRIKQFGRDESGAFAVIFGVIAIVLIATGGSAVDFVNIQQARKTTQISLDATVLALQPEIYKKSMGWIKNRANDLVEESLAGTDVAMSIETVQIDKDAGRLYISASISRPTLFVKLVGINQMSALLISEATRAKNLLEVVMVLDNSGSMQSYGRMTALKDAATLAVDTLSGGESTPDKVFIGLVPFTQYVNIGNSNRKAKGVDINGQSPLSWDNFDDDNNPSTGHDTTNPSDRLNRLAKYAAIPNASWKGCVEARSHDTSKPEASRLDVNDVAPSYDFLPGFDYGETLFVPVFEPDLPDWSYWNQRGYMRDIKGGCSWNNSDRVRQEKECKYNGQWVDYGSGENGDGPNAGCGDAEVLPLTNKMSDVKSGINAMVAEGGTNIHQGAIWGLRVLSPTAPFTEGVGYNEGASKVMILMTDGANYASQWGNFNGAYYYSAYGWPYNGRLGGVGWSNYSTIKEMDKRTKLSCERAKDAGIEVYTIGLSISSTSSNGKMLSACATSSSHDFFPNSTTELKDTFETIADQLSDLRISK